MTRLGDIISGKVFSVPPTATVAEAAETMVKGRVGSAVVVDGPWLLGIFTERDALRVAAAGVDPTATGVKDWMTKDPSPSIPTPTATTPPPSWPPKGSGTCRWSTATRWSAS